MKMNSKHNQIRALGQRSISSSFISGSSNIGKGDAQKKGLNKDSRISLSDFLDQKLHTNPVPQKIVKGKSRPFRSPLDTRNDDGSTDHGIGIKEEEKETNSVINQVVFEQFKHNNVEKGDVIGSSGGGGGDGNDGEIRAFSTSFIISSAHAGEIGTSNSICKQETRERRNPFEDANGSGWWDCDMEGVDAEEVGLGEIWEGVGSTTFGGAEWH